ncbi:MAG: sigma-70 family RNA polymerase sigma factor [Thermoleophilia bacterium]
MPSSAESALVDAARSGDDQAYRRLVEARRPELHAHCYRMLGSYQDAEDALQEALLRAWRGLPRFDGRSSFRTWIYRIATNACLDAIGRRGRRALPLHEVPAARAADGFPEPMAEQVWVEPYPDERIGLADGAAGPDARYEQREAVELAFVAAVQNLPPRQRAALVLRDVLGFSAQEAAGILETSVAALNSALQRAREGVEARAPQRTQQQTLRALGDAGVRELVRRYTDALERADVEAVVGLLTEDAAWSMPPLTTWYGGLDAIRGFLAEHGLSVRWRHRPTRANGQLAVGCYAWDESRGLYVASVLDVLTVRGDRIADVTGFATADVFRRLAFEGPPYVASPVFRRFGLPDDLPA